MPTLNPYLTFTGNCREAMTFYKECLGGELSLMVVAESPVADQMPLQYKDQILHASLKKDGLEIMASDMQPEKIIEGNAVHLCLGCKTEEETRKLYDKLSAGGKSNQPIHEMFFGLIGVLTDKFGKRWMLVSDNG
jgi:PhnB protein